MSFQDSLLNLMKFLLFCIIFYYYFHIRPFYVALSLCWGYSAHHGLQLEVDGLSEILFLRSESFLTQNFPYQSAARLLQYPLSILHNNKRIIFCSEIPSISLFVFFIFIIIITIPFACQRLSPYQILRSYFFWANFSSIV